MAQKVGSIYVGLTADVGSAIGRFNTASAAINRFGARANRDLTTVDARMRQLNGAVAGLATGLTRGMATLGIGLAGTLSVSSIQKYADAWTRAQNQLKVAGLEGEELRATLDSLFRIAQRNGTAIEPLATLYGRLASVQAELGASGADLQKFTEGVSLALRVAGTDAAGASGALLQLSQALGGGVVRAEEFNSVLEGARPILTAVANGLQEAGGSVSTLRNLVNSGKVSSEAFFRAFLAGLGGIEKQAESTASTTDQAMSRITNSLTRLIGELDKASGISGEFAGILEAIAGGLDTAADRADLFVTAAREIYKALNPLSGLSLENLRAIFGAIEYNDPIAGGPPRRSGQRGPLTRPAATDIGTITPVSLADFTLPGDDEAKKSRERTDAWARETAAIMARTEALRLEADILGKSTYEAEKARIAHELLAAAQAEGVEVTPELQAQIDALAGAYAEAAANLESMTVAQNRAILAMEEVRDIGRDVLGGFIADLRRGEDAADALASALDRVLDRLLDIALNSLFGDGPGLSGILSALTGGGGGGGGLSYVSGGLNHAGGRVGDPGRVRRRVPTLAAINAPRFHAGLTSNEFVSVLQKGEHVLTERMARSAAATIGGLSALAQGGGGGGPPEIHIHEAAGTQASVNQRQDGSLDIIIEQKINDAMGRSVQDRRGGAAAFEKAYGLDRTSGLKRRR